MLFILNPRQLQEALDRTHGRELIALLEYAGPYEDDPVYGARVSEWLIAHGKVPDANS